MKIYFTASIAQKQDYEQYYNKIIEVLSDSGKVQHEHITGVNVEDIKNNSPEEKVDYYKNTIKSIMAADLVVAEASFPSTLNIGHEVSIALEKGKPTIVLYKKGQESHFLHGLQSNQLFLVEYSDENDLKEVLLDTLEFAKGVSDTRFNFFISPRHSTYLDWISQHRRIPRSVYLRNLIKRDMEENSDFAEV